MVSSASLVRPEMASLPWLSRSNKVPRERSAGTSVGITGAVLGAAPLLSLVVGDGLVPVCVADGSGWTEAESAGPGNEAGHRAQVVRPRPATTTGRAHSQGLLRDSTRMFAM